MSSTLDIRNTIVKYKNDYDRRSNKILLLYIAIYKGLYIALGGKKGIALSNKFDSAVYYSNIIFKYKLKLNNCVNKRNAVNYLIKTLRENFKQPTIYLRNQIPIENKDIATLLADIIASENIEDLVVNHNNVYNITLEALEKLQYEMKWSTLDENSL